MKRKLQSLKTVTDPSEFICSICQHIYDDPVVCQDGHVFCRACISQWLSTNPTCPIDRKPLTKTNLNTIPLFMQNTMTSLPVYCPNQDCEWIGPFTEIDSHLCKECAYNTVECEQCREKIIGSKLESHLTDSCQYRNISCEHCKIVVPLSKMEYHLEWKCPVYENRSIHCHTCHNVYSQKDIIPHLEANLTAHVRLQGKLIHQLYKRLKLPNHSLKFRVVFNLERSALFIFEGLKWILAFKKLTQTPTCQLTLYAVNHNDNFAVIEVSNISLYVNQEIVASNHSFRSDGTMLHNDTWSKFGVGITNIPIPENGTFDIEIRRNLYPQL